MKKELLAEIKRIKEIMFLKEGLGSQFAGRITANIGMRDALRRFLQNTTIFADDAQRAANLRRFDNDEFSLVLDNLSSIFLGKLRNMADDRAFAEFDNLMSELDPSYLRKMQADAANSSVDDIVLRTSYLDSDVGEMYMQRVLKQRSTMGGGGGLPAPSGTGLPKLTRDEFDKIKNSREFRETFGEFTGEAKKIVDEIYEKTPGAISLDDYYTNVLPLIQSRVRQMVTIRLQNQGLSAAQAAAQAEVAVAKIQKYKKIANMFLPKKAPSSWKIWAWVFSICAIMIGLGFIGKSRKWWITKMFWDEAEEMIGNGMDYIIHGPSEDGETMTPEEAKKKGQEDLKQFKDSLNQILNELQKDIIDTGGVVTDLETDKGEPAVIDVDDKGGVKITPVDGSDTDTDTTPTETTPTDTKTKEDIIGMNKPNPTSKRRFT